MGKAVKKHSVIVQISKSEDNTTVRAHINMIRNMAMMMVVLKIKLMMMRTVIKLTEQKSPKETLGQVRSQILSNRV